MNPKEVYVYKWPQHMFQTTNNSPACQLGPDSPAQIRKTLHLNEFIGKTTWTAVENQIHMKSCHDFFHKLRITKSLVIWVVVWKFQKRKAQRLKETDTIFPQNNAGSLAWIRLHILIYKCITNTWEAFLPY